MRFRLRFGKSGKLGRLTPQQESVLERHEAGELSDEETARELGGHVKTWKWSFDSRGEKQPKPAAAPSPAPAEPAADDPAKALVERIALEIDAES